MTQVRENSPECVFVFKSRMKTEFLNLRLKVRSALQSLPFPCSTGIQKLSSTWAGGNALRTLRADVHGCLWLCDMSSWSISFDVKLIPGAPDRYSPRTKMNSFQPLFRWNRSSNKYQATRPNRRILSGRDQKLKRTRGRNLTSEPSAWKYDRTLLKVPGSQILSLHKKPLLIPNEESGKPLRQTFNLQIWKMEQHNADTYRNTKSESFPSPRVANVFLYQ